MLYLMLAIAAEVAGTTSIKLSEQFTKVAPSETMLVSYGMNFLTLDLVLKQIDLGFAYAVWSSM